VSCHVPDQKVRSIVVAARRPVQRQPEIIFPKYMNHLLPRPDYAVPVAMSQPVQP
jgi:hypothetical protein